jgi:hypothetical protein
MCANKKWGRIVTLAVGKEQCDVVDRVATGRNRLGDESSPCQ